MKENIVYIGEWKEAYLCAECGEYLSSSVTQSHWGLPCHSCGSVGAYCPDTVKTSRRFICTFSPNFFQRLFGKKESGYYEWSGKTESGEQLGSIYTKNRVVANRTTIIAAAGISSGLF